MRSPDGLNATLSDSAVVILVVPTGLDSRPVVTSQARRILSFVDKVRTRLPEVSKSANRQPFLPNPRSTIESTPELESQTRTVPSSEEETTRLPDGLR